MQCAKAGHGAYFEIPVFSKLLGSGEAFFLGAGASILALNEGRALPKSAVFARS
jgi:hypothetical protein